eukprot:CAMPEP_0180521650 /NCGR_PEP_ID=MMETSP1036_2-20121128/56944_1 /TAXON_ID=632150 /ORGANISM="Azadinium spinosum, Strain 3D9" /LENGTH=62 /DNA_ID=CAMNT_0022534289 /DNA_START=162 /DNA_END=350 /DNA_ORIENTATION=+
MASTSIMRPPFLRLRHGPQPLQAPQEEMIAVERGQPPNALDDHLKRSWLRATSAEMRLKGNG